MVYFRKEPLLGHSEGQLSPADAGGDGARIGPTVIVKGRQPKGPIHDGITIIQLNKCYRSVSICS